MYPSRVVLRLLCLLCTSSIGVAPVDAQVTVGNLPEQAVEWLQEYIRIDTVNPPGNEIAGARFLAAIFEAEGIPYEIVESARGQPGHGSRPQVATSATRLVAALDRLREHQFEARVVPAVDVYCRGLAATMPSPWRGRRGTMREGS